MVKILWSSVNKVVWSTFTNVVNFLVYDVNGIQTKRISGSCTLRKKTTWNCNSSNNGKGFGPLIANVIFIKGWQH